MKPNGASPSAEQTKGGTTDTGHPKMKNLVYITSESYVFFLDVPGILLLPRKKQVILSDNVY